MFKHTELRNQRQGAENQICRILQKILRFQNYGMRSAGETKCKFPNLKITFAMRGKPCFTWRKHAHRICHYDSSCVTYTERDRMFSTNQNHPRFGKRKRHPGGFNPSSKRSRSLSLPTSPPLGIL